MNLFFYIAVIVFHHHIYIYSLEILPKVHQNSYLQRKVHPRLPALASETPSASFAVSPKTSVAEVNAALNHGLYYHQRMTSLPSSKAFDLPTTTPTTSTKPALNHELYKGLQTPTSAPSSASPNSTSSAGIETALDPEKWDNVTQAKCNDALDVLDPNKMNAFGIAVCYNVATFDKYKGTFESDLRLYRLEAPRSDWIFLKYQGVSVDLEYVDTAVSSVQIISKSYQRESHSFTTGETGTHPLLEPSSQIPLMVGMLRYDGKFNVNVMSLNLLEEAWRALLTPQIKLIGTAPNGTLISLLLSPADGVAFLVGSFAKQENARANNLLPAQTPAAPGPRTPVVDFSQFELPGTRLATFPTGLIITLVWVALVAATDVYGRVQRTKARDRYRRRLMLSLSMETMSRRRDS